MPAEVVLEVPAAKMMRPARRGMLGLCTACHEPVADHIDWERKQWLGCADDSVDIDTVFNLVPQASGVTDVRQAGLDASGRRRTTPRPLPAPAEPLTPSRGFRRARYFAEGEAVPDSLGDTNSRVLHAVLTRRTRGALLSDIIHKTGLKRGNVGYALKWLVDHGHLRAVEDKPGSAPKP